MERRVWWRLAAMMALVYGVQGAWYPLLSVHLDGLGYTGRARGLIFATMAFGSVAAPLAIGRLADRRFAIEKLLFAAYCGGAILLATIAVSSRTAVAAPALFALFLAYWLLIAPAISLSTTLALRNLGKPADQFGGVRAAGTLGWMLAGWVVVPVVWLTSGRSGGSAAEAGFWLGAILSAGLAAFARFGLPHTPPRPPRAEIDGVRPRADPWAVLRSPGVASYLITAFGVSLTLPYMYQVMPPYLVARGLPLPWVAGVMGLGQILEIAALALLPGLIRRFGLTRTLAFGIVCWAARYAQLSTDPPLSQAIAGTLLHGLGIACFSVAGQMHLDSHAPPDRRAEAQGLHSMITSGAGVLLGSLLAGEAAAGQAASGSIFLLPLLLSAVCLLYWLFAARSRRPGLLTLPVGPDTADRPSTAA